MRKYAMAACLFMAALNVCAQTKEKDSLRVIDLQEVEIISTRATGTTPVAFTNINKEQLKKQNFGQDLPYLLSMTPSAITTSDAGAGIGYTTLRVRGTDGTRINVTANGIPINDAESHNVFWVNLPDFASSVKDMQIQRGAGTSTNGAGAFGASINMQTGDFSLKPYAELNGSYGSFNTHKETVKAGTGLINGHWSFDARLSNISSDGYIDRASVGLNSYYLQGGYYNDNTSVKLITFGGKERTYHAWNYASKEEMEKYQVLPKHLEGIVQQLRATKDVEAAIFLYENEDGSFKASMRSSGKVDVAVIMMSYGGGGHIRAAGATIEGNAKEILEGIVKDVEKQLLK